MNIHSAATINIYSMPEAGHFVRFADGSMWVIKQYSRNGWGLFHVENNVLHTAIGEHKAMVDFCTAINEQDEFVKWTLTTTRGK